MGFIFLGFSLGTFEGYHATLVYLVLYLFLNLSLFGIILSLRKNSGQLLIYINELTSVFRTNPILAVLLTITLFSLAGIPPLAGFFSKFYLIISLISSNLYSIAFICVFISVYSCIYYIRLIKIIFFEKPFV
jgi:NADH-quinone oxidoreductase subunit N